MQLANTTYIKFILATERWTDLGFANSISKE